MKNILTTAFLIATTFCAAQTWTTMMQEPGRNFYEIRAEFNNYWKDKNTDEKGRGYKQFKRWEHFVAPRVYPTGDLSLISNNWKNFQAFVDDNYAPHKMQSSSTWTAMGPHGAMTGVASNGFPRKAGRDNFITFDPTNVNTYWVGAPSGGLWKTTTNGTSWTTNTDNLPVIGCSDLAIDPSNPSIMYLATGDGDAGDTYCIGVLKSIDGGSTWNPTGLVFNVSQERRMRRLIINPINPQILLAATNAGVFRTIDGGTTWTQVNGIDSYDVEFKPGNPNTVYAGAQAFYRSTNGGSSFTMITSGIGSAGINRMNIAVTPADTNYIYVLASNSGNNGLQGVYRSLNSGATFSLMANSPDLLANSCGSNPTGGGQGWYDLAFAASPLNKNEIVVGGINAWRSTNGGVSYSIIGCWIGTGNPPYVHADHHELEYTPAGVLYSANDGGIFRYTGTAWTDLTNPRNIAQIYKIGLSSKSPNLWITGHQDNGTNSYNGSAYLARLAGDGMDCFIDRTNDNNMFASQYNGNFYRSTNGGVSWTSANSGHPGGGAWVTPWKQDPNFPTRLHAGFSSLYVSNNLGVSWSALSSPGGSGNIVEFAVAPSNSQVIYIIRGTSIRKSLNAGSNWTNVTGSIPVTLADPTFITIDPNNSNKVWVTLSGYSAGNKVFFTANGGSTWTNISSNLPNLPANCSVYQAGSDDRIYVGMDVGVYYKDNTSTSWTLYNSGLPNVPISDMEISPANPTKLRAATYGRGVYEVDVINPVSTPVSNFYKTNSICSGAAETFSDQSTNGATSWSWSVTPAAGVVISSANAQHPIINFPTGGSYSVSLTASNGFGAGNTTVKVVSVTATPSINFLMASRTVCKDEIVTIQLSGSSSYTWAHTSSTDSVMVFTAQQPQYIYTVTASNKGCVTSDTVRIDVSECTGLTDNTSGNSMLEIFPNPAFNSITVAVHSDKIQSAALEITNVAGQVVIKEMAFLKSGNNEIPFNISTLPKGVYFVKLSVTQGKDKTIKFLKE